MSKLFGVNISGLIAKHVGRGLPLVSLVKMTKGSRTAGQLAGGTNPTATTYPCRGVAVSQDRRSREDAPPVTDGTRRFLLIGDTISGGAVAPEIGDRIVAEGKTFLIERIERDPAKATYVCTVRPR